MNREALKSDAQTLAKGWLMSEAAAYKRLGEGVLSLLAERDQLRELCHRAWALLEVVEPNDPITDELYNALRRAVSEEDS